MRYIKRNVFVLFCILIFFGGISCSDSSGSSDPSVPVVSSSISGIIAGGAAVAGTVYVKDSTGAVKSAAINADGSYSISVGDMTAPFLIYAEGTCGAQSVSLYSYAEGPGRANVTPITTMILAMAAQGDPETLFPPDQMKGSTPLTNTMPSSTEVASAVQTVADLFEDVYDDFSIPEDFNPLTGSFTVGSPGFDTLLDIIGVDVEGTDVTVTDTLTGSVVYSDDVANDTDTPVNNIDDLAENVGPVIGIVEVVNQWETLVNQYLAGSITISSFRTQFNALLSDDFAEGDDDGVLDREGFVTDSAEHVHDLAFFGYQRIELSVQVHICSQSESIEPEEYGYGLWFGIMSFSYYGAGNVLLHECNKTMSFKEEGSWKICGNRKYVPSSMFAVHHKEIRPGQAPNIYTGIDISIDFEDEIHVPPSYNSEELAYVIVKGDGIQSDLAPGGEQGLIFQLVNDEYDGYYYSDANFSRDSELYYGGYISAADFNPELVEDRAYLFLGLNSTFELCCFWFDTFYYDTVKPSERDQSQFVNFDGAFNPSLDAMGITGEISATNPWNLTLNYSSSSHDPVSFDFEIYGLMTVDDGYGEPYMSMYEGFLEYSYGDIDGAENALTYNPDANSITINIWNILNGDDGAFTWYSGSDITALPDDISDMYLEFADEGIGGWYVTGIYFKEYSLE